MPLSRLFLPDRRPEAAEQAADRGPPRGGGVPGRPRTGIPPRREGFGRRPAWPASGYSGRPVRFGLDFGTSNTSLAAFDGAAVRVLPLDPIAGETLPTVLYIRRDGTPIVGRRA